MRVRIREEAWIWKSKYGIKHSKSEITFPSKTTLKIDIWEKKVQGTKQQIFFFRKREMSDSDSENESSRRSFSNIPQINLNLPEVSLLIKNSWFNVILDNISKPRRKVPNRKLENWRIGKFVCSNFDLGWLFHIQTRFQFLGRNFF